MRIAIEGTLRRFDCRMTRAEVSRAMERDFQRSVGQAYAEVAGDGLEDRFAAREKEKEIDRLLAELKSGKMLGAFAAPLRNPV